LDYSNITTPVVAVGGTALTAGTDYTYTPPAARGDTMSFVLNTPVNPGECVTVDYSIGFYTDLTSQTSWSNEARLLHYESLPTDGRIYDSSADQAQVWMTNLVSIEPLSKTLTSPVEATIGETVTYKITVPSLPVNAALDNVVVTDTHPERCAAGHHPHPVRAGPELGHWLDPGRRAGGDHTDRPRGQQRPGQRRGQHQQHRLLYLRRDPRWIRYISYQQCIDHYRAGTGHR